MKEYEYDKKIEMKNGGEGKKLWKRIEKEIEEVDD